MILPPRVTPGQPIRAAHQNLLIDAVRKLSGVRLQRIGVPQRSRATGTVSVPFEVSVVKRDDTYYIQNAPGYWTGRGTGDVSRGVLPDYDFDDEGNPQNPWPEIANEGFDMFRIHACEWNLGSGLIAGKRYLVFLRADVLGGGVLEKHPKIYLVEEDETLPDSDRFHIEAYTAATLVAVVKTQIKNNSVAYSVDQVLASGFSYSIPPNATAPFRWWRKDGTLNTFGCFGGLVRCQSVRFRGPDVRSHPDWPYDGGEILCPSDAELEQFKELTVVVPGEEFAFTEAEIDAGVVIFLQVDIDSGAARTTWIMRSLAGSGLSSLEIGNGSGDAPSTPVECQRILLGLYFTEYGFVRHPHVDGRPEWTSCVPMAIVRRAGNSRCPDVLTIHSGVVDVRPILELHFVHFSAWYKDYNCEGAVDPSAVVQEAFDASEGALQEFGDKSESTTASSFALENDELEQASNFEA